MRHLKRRMLATFSCVALAGGAFSFSALAQDTVPERVVIGALPPAQGESNNPNRDIAPDDEFQLKPMYENLVGVDPETSAWIPMLATSWQINEEGTQLTFTLREDVQFHNDFGEFTAEDVVFSLDDVMTPPGALSDSGNKLRAAVEEFEIVDDHTLIFHLTEDGIGLPFFEAISYGAAGTAIKSKADWDSRGGGKPATPSLDEDPIAGTGPYQFVERSPGDNVVFERVPYDHWRKNADFQELEIRFILENATRLSSLLAGEVHLATLPSELAEEAVQRGMEIIRSSIAGRRYGMNFVGCYYVEPWNPNLPSAEVYTSGERRHPDSPWCDRDLRIAANKAVDRQAINEAFYVGKAEVAPQWFHLPEQSDSWDPSWPERYEELLGYDPEGAREILEEHGEPVEVQVYALDDVSEAVANMLADVGFDVEILSMDTAMFHATAEAREFSNVLLHDNVASEIITSFEPTGYANSDTGRAVEMVEWDTMYEEILAEIDDERRAELWREFGDVILEEAMLIPLVRNYTEFVVNPQVVCGYTNPGANVSTVWVFFAHIEAC